MKKWLLRWLLKDEVQKAYARLQEARKPMAQPDHSVNQLHLFLQADAWYFGLISVVGED